MPFFLSILDHAKSKIDWFFSFQKMGMYSHQRSSSSPIMEVENEVVDQELEVEENADEMSEEELDLDTLEPSNEGAETRQKGDNEGAKPFEKK